MARCRLCDATGFILLMRSWFTEDGFRRERCHFCHGMGESKARAPDWEREQKGFRERASA